MAQNMQRHLFLQAPPRRHPLEGMLYLQSAQTLVLEHFVFLSLSALCDEQGKATV